MEQASVIDWRAEDGIGIFHFRDSIELYNVDPTRRDLIKAIDENSFSTAIFVMDEVPFIDSSGLAIFLSLRQYFGERLRFAFAGMQSNVRSVFEYANLLTHFTICSTVSEARKALTGT